MLTEKFVKDTRGQTMGSLPGIVLGFVILAIILGVGLLVLDEFSGQLDPGSAAQTAVNETIAAVAEIPGWLPILVIVIIAVVIIALVVRGFRPQGGM